MREFDGKYVIIMLCSTCNINCKHCYISYEGNFDYDTAKDLIINLKKQNYNILLNGSEPILNKEYYDLFKFANCNKILTNGLLLVKNRKVIKALKDNGINEICLSYHLGIQDELSVVKIEELDELIPDLLENGMTVKLMTTITKSNMNIIEDLCSKAKKLGVQKVRFTNLVNQGEGKNMSERVLSRDDIVEVLLRINQVRELYDKNELEIQRCGTFGAEIDCNFKCTAGIDSIVIAPNLKAYPCVFSTEKGNEIGYYDGEKILIHDYYENKQKKCLVRKQYNGF